MRNTVLACLCTGLLACDPVPVDTPEPTPEPPFDPAAYEVLSSELTEADREMSLGNGGENVFAAQRLRLDTPARIVAVEAMFKVRREHTADAHLAIWPDWGHNFFDFDRPNPLWEFTGPLDRFESDEQWTLFELEEPIDLTHPQLLYVGTWHRGTDEEPVLMVDGQNSVDPFLAEYADADTQYPPHVAVYPDRGRDSGGFESVSFAPGGGDLLVRLYIERYDVVEQTWFTEQQAAEDDPRSGLPGVGSVAWGDCDDDGLLDVYNGNLWVNQGDGTFVSTTAEAGIDAAGGAGMWGDYDNDGLLDLFVARTDDQLYRGLGGCTFENVTLVSGIDDTQPFDNGEGVVEQNVPTPSAAWLDVDGDGWLDLYQANFMNFGSGDSAVDMLWHNQGDGTFAEVSADLGMSQGGGRAGRGVHPADWDNDGDMDIYVSNYRLHQNFAWQNDGGGFTGIQNNSLLGGYRNNSAGTVSYFGHTIGSTWGDVDNDGDLDLFAANLAHPRFFSFSDKSMFLQNLLAETGTLDWADVRDDAGMLYQETDSSPILFDLDNDGDLDLFYTAVYPARPSYLYRNDGDWSFSMVSYPAGTWIWNGWGVAAADYDNDGDMDIYGGKLLRNDTAAEGGWISVQAVGSGGGASNVSAIGARIYVTTDAGEQLREVSSGVGVGCQMPLRQHVGLGMATEADVRVEFPATGTVIDVGAVPSGTRLEVHEDGTTNL